jgi:osmotically-inducible protein OsmY
VVNNDILEDPMTTATLVHTDARVRENVLHQLEWDTEVDASAIGVTAHEGAVTLSGFIDTYAGKLAAERAAKRVRGVRAVANELQVRLRLDKADDELAADIARALVLRNAIPPSVQAVVHQGRVTLTGTVPWLFHRAAAEAAVRHLHGVVGITNRIEVAPGASIKDVRHRITEALHRVADLNARHVSVTVTGSTATLAGTVTSWAQRDTAERAAAHAPGIARVENLIEVRPGEL